MKLCYYSKPTQLFELQQLRQLSLFISFKYVASSYIPTPSQFWAYKNKLLDTVSHFVPVFGSRETAFGGGTPITSSGTVLTFVIQEGLRTISLIKTIAQFLGSFYVDSCLRYLQAVEIWMTNSITIEASNTKINIRPSLNVYSMYAVQYIDTKHAPHTCSMK